MSDVRLLRPPELAADALDWTGRWRGSDVWAALTAAREGDVGRLRALLDEDASLVDASYGYTKPLHFAVREGHLAATRLLVDAGADLTYRGPLDGNDTLLRMAEDRGHEPVASYLRQELLARLGSDGTQHPIHVAVAAGDAEAVASLLDRDAGLVHRGDALGRRPLHYAVERGRRDLVDLLLDRGAEIDAIGFGGDDRLGGYGFRPLVLALWHHPYWRQRNDYGMARHLLARGAEESIVIAAALGDARRVAELIDADRARVDHQEPGGKRPLSAAAERDHEAIVRLLLEAGADPNLPEGANCPRGYALWAASHFGHRRVARLLLEAGADPNADVESSGTPTESAADAEMRALLYGHGGRMRLPALCWEGRVDAVAALLDARPERFDEIALAEALPLCVAAGHATLLRVLLARGLRVPAVVSGCQTYLWESIELTRLLLDHGMDPDLPSWQQVRPLHRMAARGEIEPARLFVERGADVDALDEEYRSTPLGWAARCGQTGFARFLLERGADRAAPASPAWARPIEWARRRGHAATVALLEGRAGP